MSLEALINQRLPKPPCVECGKPAYCSYRRVGSKIRDAFCRDCEAQLVYQGSGKTVAEQGVPPAQNAKAQPAGAVADG